MTPPRPEAGRPNAMKSAGLSGDGEPNGMMAAARLEAVLAKMKG